MKILQLFCGSLIAFSITSCTSKPASVENSIATTKTVTSAPQNTASGFTALLEVIRSTEKAIVAGRLDRAKIEFTKFENSWKTVEDGVKSKSADTYKAIENEVGLVNSGIASKQSKDILLTNLQKLKRSIIKASQQQSISNSQVGNLI
ncbi:DUF4363 domain-containing protein [Chamaesiphon polymorphus]|nr:DUF4363 domain-containing protein [Chamaesiphon polymorphus]